MGETKILVLFLTLLLLSGSKCKNLEKILAKYKYTTHRTILTPLHEMKHVAHFGDAEHRGPAWYDFTSGVSREISDFDSEVTDTSRSLSDESSSSDSLSDSVSSLETDESKLHDRVYRTCTPCPHDMLKKYTNIGIKWICGAYQRARRTFKSECMMRYRNCEDGTMFTKIADHRCKNDSYHGRHWFYVYRV